jgi:hypothetical protein
LLSEADELFFGGAAGGGKSDLIIGLSIECHQHSAIFRRTYPNLTEIMRRAREIIGDHARENKSEKIWTFPDGRTLEFGAVQYEDDKANWQGRPHDLKAFDELPEFSESQYEFICGWNRSVDPGQRVRVVATGNPPLDEAGSWIVRRWGAWLDPNHPHPAKDGELRFYATVDGQEIERESGDPFDHKGETIYPRSRTFVRSLLSDNPFYAHDSHYISVLQSLPEPMRSQLLHGDFAASQTPNPWQVIPSEWVRAAQRRWMVQGKPETPITAVGIDPSRGGNDKTAMSERYDNYFDQLHTWPGSEAVDGPTVAGMTQRVLQDKHPGYINVDVVGIGSSVFDSLKVMYDDVFAFNGAEGSDYRDRSGKLKMRNRRAEAYWQMRDALDPELGDDLALPSGNELLADLCAARYEVTAAGVLIEEKAKIKERIGRSPDMGEAVLMSNFFDSSRGPSPQAWIAAIKKRNEERKTGVRHGN